MINQYPDRVETDEKAFPSIDPFERNILIAGSLFYICASIFFIYYHNIIIDIGVYLYQGLRIFNGEMPYRDFFVPQGPVILYFYGFIQKLFGPDLYLGRWTAVAISLTLLFLVTWISWKRGGKYAGIISFSLFCGMLHLCDLYSVVKTHGITALIIIASVAFLIKSEKQPRFLYLATFFAGLAVASRITSIMIAPAMWLYIIYQHHIIRWRLLICFSTYLFGIIILFLPSIGPDTLDNIFYALFWVQLLRGADPMTSGGNLIRLKVITDIFNFFYPVVIIGCILVYGFLKQKSWSRFKLELTLFGMCISVSLLYLIPEQITWVHYQLDVLPIYVILAALGISRWLYINHIQQTRTIYKWMVIVIILFSSVHLNKKILFPYVNANSLGYLPLEHLYETADKLKPLITDSGKIMCFEAYIPLLLNRQVIPNLGAMMCYVPQWSTEQCKKQKVINDEMLLHSLIAREPELIMFTQADFSILKAHQSYSHQMTLTQEEKRNLPLIDEKVILDNGYKLIALVTYFGQSKTTLKIFRKMNEYNF